MDSIFCYLNSTVLHSATTDIMRMCMTCRKNCFLVYHVTQSYCISSGKEGFASRQHRCTSLLHLLCLIERNEWALFYPVEIVCDWTWWSTEAHWKHNGILEEEIQKIVVAIYTWMKRWYPSVCAGSAGFGWSSKSWMPTRICFTVMAGLHPYIYHNVFHVISELHQYGWALTQCITLASNC